MELKSRPRPSSDDKITNNVILIISPLSRLMVDQTERLQKLGLKYVFVEELQADRAVKSAIAKARYPIVFITPEAESVIE